MDADSFWHAFGNATIIAAALTVARLVLEHFLSAADRRLDREERGGRQRRDAEARLERLLQDRLADADRRLEHFEFDLHAERLRCGALEQEYARLQQAHDLLKEQHASLQAQRGQPHPQIKAVRVPKLPLPAKPTQSS